MKRSVPRLAPAMALVAAMSAVSPMAVAEVGKWAERRPMPTARAMLATAVVNERVYTIGGTTGGPFAAWKFLSAVEEYDPAMNRWTRKADMPTARFIMSTSVVNGNMHAIGGGTGDFLPPLDVVEEYDPVANKWTKKASMPEVSTVASTERSMQLAASQIPG